MKAPETSAFASGTREEISQPGSVQFFDSSGLVSLVLSNALGKVNWLTTSPAPVRIQLLNSCFP